MAPGKRNMSVPLTEYPNVTEWEEHMSQLGKEGGCLAHKIAVTKTSLSHEAIQMNCEHDESNYIKRN